MRYKVIYENNRGQRVNLSERPYFLNIEPILDYQWSYSEKEKRRGNIIAGFAKDIQSVDLTLHIMDANAGARDEAVDYFNNVIEADIYDGIAGRLIIGDWYTWGYIIASKNTKWQYGKPVVKKVVKLVREQENWYHVVQKANYGSEQAEELYNFIEEDIKTYEGADTNSLKSLTATINPKQDLHGYDKPWVGGAGKNKISLPSKRGYWAATNGVFSTDYTWAATEKIPVLPSTTYHISCSFVTRWCGIAAYQSDGTYIDSNLGDTSSSAGHVVDRTFTTQSNCGYIAVSIANTDGQSFQPSSITDLQVELGSTATSYAPHSNICPISGWDSVNLYKNGKNLLDVVGRTITSYSGGGVKTIRSEGGTASKDGDVVTQVTSGIWSKLWFEIDTSMLKVGQSFTFSATIDNPSGNRINVGYRKGSSWTKSGTDTTETHVKKSITFTPDSSLTDFYFAVYTNNTDTATNATVTVSEIQLELGSTATDYEPYQADTYATDLPETVYGGSLDVVNGVLTVDRAMVDLGTLTWNYNASWGGYPAFYCSVAPTGIKVSSTSNTLIGAICSQYTEVTRDYLYSNNVTAFCIPPDGKVSVRDSRYTSASDFKTAMNGVRLVYELAEPRTIQLTPKQVTTLLGTNNVWADSGDVTVEYWDDAGRIKTASGSVVTFGKHNLMSGAGYDYPYDYMADAQSQKRIENPNSVPCDFSITIQGYADRPEVQIGDNVIAFDLEVPYGAFLTVDSSKKTAIMTLANGEQVNVFGARDPDYYLFERIKEGKNTVTWNGSFLWEIRMLEERSEPRWHMD